MTKRIALLLIAPGLAFAAPIEVGHQGRISDADGPLEGEHQVAFSLYEASNGGDAAWSETQTVTFHDGYYAVTLGQSGPLDDSVFAAPAVFLSIAVDGGAEFAPRQKVASVPLAARAQTAAGFEGGTLDATELKIDGNTVIDDEGVVDATRLQIGGTTVIDQDGHFVGGGQTLASLTCSVDQVPIWTGTAWSCGTFPESAIVTDTEVRAAVQASPIALAAGSTVGGLPVQTGTHSWTTLTNIPAALQDGDDDSLADLSCTDGDVPLYNAGGDRWGCLKATSAGMTGAQIIALVDATPLDLDSGTRIGGKTILQAVQSSPVTLAAGSTLNGVAIQTGAHDWNTLLNIPASLLDGDSDALKSLGCGTGDVPVYSTQFQSWGCLDLQAEVVATVASTPLDLGPNTTFGDQTIAEIVESEPLDLAPGTTLGGDEIALRGESGGEVYTAWGRNTCRSPDTLLYTGLVFASHSSHGGARDIECFKGGDPGPSDGYDGDILYADSISVSTGTTNVNDDALQCAVCLSNTSPCFTTWGTSSCPSGFSARSTGFSYGGHYTNSGPDRFCLDGTQQGDPSGVDGTGGFYPTTFHSVPGGPFTAQYPVDNAVKCAQCCRQ